MVGTFPSPKDPCSPPAEIAAKISFRANLQFTTASANLIGGLGGAMMPEIALNCANATLHVDAEGIFHLRLARGSTVSSADVDCVVAAIQSVSGSDLQPMLIEVVDSGISPAAREALLAVRIASAVALVGTTVVDRVIAAALMRGKGCPHQYFTSVEAAKDWLSRRPASQPVAAPTL